MKKQTSAPPRTQLIQVARLFRIMSEPTRLEILHELEGGELSVSSLVAKLDAKQANISKQLGILLDTGLVNKKRAGNLALYSIADPLIFELCALVCGKLRRDALATLKRLSR